MDFLKDGEKVEDLMIGGLKIIQSDKLYRFSSDSILLSKFAEYKKGDVVADFCAGSGIVGLHFYALNPSAERIDLYELQKPLCDMAERSVALNSLQSVIFCHNGRVQDIPAEKNGKYSLILCNPPYIRTGDIGGLMEEVRLHEPESALDGGEDGLLFYRRIAKEAGEHLFDGGSLILEIGAGQGDEVREILENKGFGHIKVLKDYSGNERVVKCLKSLKKQY